MAEIREMMQGRTAAATILLAFLFAAPGCTSPETTPTLASTATPEVALPTTVPVLYEGVTGQVACLETLLTLDCPVSERGTLDSWDFACGSGFYPSALAANLTWDASGTPPPQFEVDLWSLPHNDTNADGTHIRAWSTTTTPVPFDFDLTPYAGTRIHVYLYAWRVVGSPDAADVRYSTGEAFRFEGNLTCAPAA